MTCNHAINAPMPGCSSCRRKRVKNKHSDGLQSPGTRIASLIAQRYENWGVKACQACSETARKMDAKGADWCLARIDTLAEEIHQNAKRQTNGTGKWLDLLAYSVYGLEKYKALIREACYMLPRDIMPDLHRQASDPAALQFLWMYWAPPAEGNEIYWSIASVLKHAAPARITVFGSHPGKWYTGEHIPFTAGPSVHRDRIEKMQMIANHEATANEFVWMMDDQYFVRPASHQQIKQPRAHVRTANTSSSWGRIRTRTKEALEKAGYRAYDYATHLPHFIEKSKLQSVFKQFSFDPPLLWETVYGCVHHTQPVNPTPYFHRHGKSAESLRALQAETSRTTVFNHVAGGWNRTTVDLLRAAIG